MNNDVIWAEVRNGVVVWVSCNSQHAAQHNISTGCHAMKYVRADEIERLREREEVRRKLSLNLHDQNKELWRALDGMTTNLHWCDDWDGMLMWDEAPEKDGCTCRFDEKGDYQ